jgi:enhancer of mRNA-decapping protein 3
MASEFIGFNVLVTLRAPPNAQIQGEVSNVIGQRLMLRDGRSARCDDWSDSNIWIPVTLCWNGQYLPTYSVEAPDIADLSVQSSNIAPAQGYAAQPSQSRSRTTPSQQPFVDPAILSFAKPHHQADHSVEPGRPQQFPSHVGQHTSGPARSSLQPQHRGPPVSAALSEPFSNLELDAHNRTSAGHEMNQGNELDGSVPMKPSGPAKSVGKKARRNARNKPQRDKWNELSPVNEHDGASNTNPKTKGWRQTAFVEPSHPHMESPQPYRESTSRLNGRRRKKTRGAYAEDTNGWATEDATDIQEMGDFDFQSNLSKFDKRRVFEEIRNDDTTADESRLASFNRRAKPGTNGGKNLHWSENVLSPQNSESDDSDEDPSEGRPSSGNYSGRDRSRASARVQASRKSNATLGQPLVPPQINTIGRGQFSTSRATSPPPGKRSVSASPINGPSASAASLRLATTNRSCPTVSPLQALEVEQIAVSELGLTEDIITENAGRGVAEAAVGLLSNDTASPTVLVLTGNHRTGARTIAAARHLRNRGHRVTVCMVGLEHQSELLESCRKQLAVFRKIGGRILRWEELAARLTASEFSPDLVVDALFGMHLTFDELRTDDQGTVFEMISWVNRSNVAALSIDVPSGLSASSGKDLQSIKYISSLTILSGEVTVIDGGRLCVNSNSVVCLGAPKTGVINALLAGEGLPSNLSVADIGVPQIVWRKYGTRRRHGIDFGNRWVVPLRFQPLAV